MHLLGQIVWGHIWKHTEEQNQTNATNVTMPLIRQALWGDIWKYIVGKKSCTNATNVTLLFKYLGLKLYSVSRCFFRKLCSWQKNLRDRRSHWSRKISTLCASSQAGNLSRHLKKHSGEKSNKCNQCDYASFRVGDLRTHLKTHCGEKPNKCNQCEFACSYSSSLRRHMKRHRSI